MKNVNCRLCQWHTQTICKDPIHFCKHPKFKNPVKLTDEDVMSIPSWCFVLTEKIRTFKEYFKDTEFDDTEIEDNIEDTILFKYNNEEYLMLTDVEVNYLIYHEIVESLWTFSIDYIVDVCNLDKSIIDPLKEVQMRMCEEVNTTLKVLVNFTVGLDTFIERAIEDHGRGYFLSRYDGEELKIDSFFMYRMA